MILDSIGSPMCLNHLCRCLDHVCLIVHCITLVRPFLPVCGNDVGTSWPLESFKYRVIMKSQAKYPEVMISFQGKDGPV